MSKTDNVLKVIAKRKEMTFKNITNKQRLKIMSHTDNILKVVTNGQHLKDVAATQQVSERFLGQATFIKLSQPHIL